jgi:TPR repeat protein
MAALLAAACGANYYDKAPPLPAGPALGPTKEEGPKRPAHVLGKPVPQDIEDTAWGLVLQCDGGNARACTDLGKLQASTQWNARDDARAAQLFTKACSGGDPGGCESLAEAYTHGRGVARDVRRGRELHEQACRSQRAFACATVGRYYAVGYTVERDYKRALEYLSRACEDGDSASCELRGAVEACQAGAREGCVRIDKLKARYEAQDAAERDGGSALVTAPSSAR